MVKIGVNEIIKLNGQSADGAYTMHNHSPFSGIVLEKRFGKCEEYNRRIRLNARNGKVN